MLKILVPVDLTDDSNFAGKYALALAAASPQAQLLLLHCHQDYLADADTDVPPPTEMTASEEITEQVMYRNITEAEDQLEELYQQLRAEASDLNPNTHVERAFIHGLPEDVIPEETKRFKPDLVVMATKGETNIARSFFGTVTTKVVEELHTPVLTIPADYIGKRPSKVAYATNLNATDSTAMAHIQQLLSPLNPEVYVVHVSEKADQEQQRQLQEKMQQNHANLKITYALLQGDDVAEALQAYVQREQIDILALTTHKRSLLGSIFHPSLTQKLVLEAKVPLLVFHAADEV